MAGDASGSAKNFHGGDDPEFDEYMRRRREPTAITGSGIKLNPSGHWGIAAVPTHRDAGLHRGQPGN